MNLEQLLDKLKEFCDHPIYGREKLASPQANITVVDETLEHPEHFEIASVNVISYNHIEISVR